MGCNQQNYLLKSDGSAAICTVAPVYENNAGLVSIGHTNPVSRLDINGNLTLGNAYAGTNAAPVNGAIIQGQVGIGNNAPYVASILDLTNNGGAASQQALLLPSPQNSGTPGTPIPPNVPGAPTGGLTVYNETTGCVQYYNQVVGKWFDLPIEEPATPTINGCAAVVMPNATAITYSVATANPGEVYTWSLTGTGNLFDINNDNVGDAATVTGTLASPAASVRVMWQNSGTISVSAVRCGVISRGATLVVNNANVDIVGCPVVSSTAKNVVYSVPAGAQSYVWTVTGTDAAGVANAAGATVVAGAGSNAITVSWSGINISKLSKTATSGSTTIGVTITPVPGCGLAGNIVPAPVVVTVGGFSMYSFKGVDQTLNLPEDCGGTDSVKVKLWGAGGGGAAGNTSGSGGYVRGNLRLNGATSLTVIVGQGGGRGIERPYVYGGGGLAQSNTAGNGGGRSAIQINGVEVMTAGGGGGGASLGSAPSSSPVVQNSCGGAGGGDASIDANGSGDGGHGRDGNGTGNTPALGGLVGTAAAGGAGGTGGTGGNGVAGAAFEGGDGGWITTTASSVIYYSYGGGGGGGYFGGGGGGAYLANNAVPTNANRAGAGGGGGGASYTAPSVVNPVLLQGNACNAGVNYAPNTNTAGGYSYIPYINTPDSDLPNTTIGYGASYGGSGGTTPVGGNGAVLIYW